MAALLLSHVACAVLVLGSSGIALADEGALVTTAADCYPIGAPPVKRRAVAFPGSGPCLSNPTVTVVVKPTACENEQVRIAWQASDPRARVAIKGIACDLPATGSMDVRITKETTFRAVASTCRIGPEVTRTVTVTPAPVITSFTADHPMIASGAATALHFAYEHGSSWAIGGALPFNGDPLAGASPFGGSARVTFPTVPAEPVLIVSSPCGATALALPLPACSGPGPHVDLDQALGRVAIGQTQRWRFVLAPETSSWFIETDNGRFLPPAGGRPANGELEIAYEPAAAGEATFTMFGENACGFRGIGTTQTVWNCAQPIIQSFTAGATTLNVGQSTYVSYITQERHGETGTVTSSLGNALDAPVHFPPPENRHTYTATHAGTDTVTVTVQTPCGPASASLQITVK